MDPTLLDAPLDDLLMRVRRPTRLEGAFERLGLVTVGDLVRTLPETLLTKHNIGRTSIAVAAKALSSYLGVSWSEARMLASPPGVGDSPSSPPCLPAWKQTLATLADEVRSLPVRPALPARLAKGCTRLGARTLSDLADLPDDPRRWPRVGRRSAASLQSVLESLRDDPLDGCSSWKALLRKVLGALPARSQRIVGLRAGFEGRPRTLAEVSRALRLSRERVRQIEARAIERLRSTRTWSARLADRLAATIAGESLFTLAELAEQDDFFAVAREDRRAFVFFVNELLAGPVVATRLGRDVHLSRLSSDALNARLAEIRAVAPGMPYPCAEAELNAAIARRLGCEVDLVRRLAPRLRGEWRRRGGRVLGFGAGRTSSVLALLRAHAGPIRRLEIERRLGRGPLPEQVVYVGGGRVALRERVAEWDSWSERLAAACARAMRQRGPDRQWTAEELLAILREERGEELPPWCPDAWSLVSLLCVRPELRRLGRKAFALPGATADGALLIDTVVELLARRGAAMAEDDLKAELHRVRGFSSTTWAVLRRSPPLVRLGDGTIGLSPRDVPGGPAAIARASRAAHSKLLWTQAAMNARELHRVVARLGPPIDAWSPKLLQCVLRQVGGFTFEPGGHVGLAVWGR